MGKRVNAATDYGEYRACDESRYDPRLQLTREMRACVHARARPFSFASCERHLEKKVSVINLCVVNVPFLRLIAIAMITAVSNVSSGASSL